MVALRRVLRKEAHSLLSPFANVPDSIAVWQAVEHLLDLLILACCVNIA
jgi:hypothetical protein